MTDAERRFHETWLGMAQPSEGLVVSIPVLVEAQCMAKQPREVQEAALACTEQHADGAVQLSDLSELFTRVLDLSPELFDAGEALPKPLRLYVPEGKQELRPTRALRRRSPATTRPKEEADLPAAARAGQDYLAIVWEVPAEVDLDRPETVTGPWHYPAQAKFDRLLRECRVPIGILSNRREIRLVYAPHGESSGWLSFRVADMIRVGGRPILDALVMLLGRARWFGVSAEQQLPALLEQSRRQQANVTTELSSQVFEALEHLLAGFSAAAERDRQSLLREALEAEDGHVYSGLLTLLLRLVFTLYCEDRGLLPVEKTVYAENYSVLGLYDQLESDHGRFPDSMDRRYGAYARLVSLFRAIYLGVSHGDLRMPARQGSLFHPNLYAFLEGWRAGSAPLTDADARSSVDVPAISDGTVFRVLQKLILLDGQRLSYRALDVEQIGSVYEALMGFDVERLSQSGAVRIRLGSKRGSARVWVEAARLLAVPAARRDKWLQDELGFDKAVAANIAKAVAGADDAESALQALEPLSGKARERVDLGALVIQPGPERRRTSSHYTPRSLSEPIVRKTLDPLIRAMGDRPSSNALLNLVICDPAVGSGAFLVAACRYLADHVVAAWTREVGEESAALPFGAKAGGAASIGGSGKTKLQLVADAHEDVVNHARRLVAQRCLYGVDKNPYAVQLARLSLWLVTMARDEPFTFVDHAIRHGDSLVGLNFDQIRAFHWRTGQKGEQLETTSGALNEALSEAITLRQQIQSLAADGSSEGQQEKVSLFRQAEDAVSRVRLIADLVVGAFFAFEKDKDREDERNRRLDLVNLWLAASAERDSACEDELRAQLNQLQAEFRKTHTPFHWMSEFPEVFYSGRPDPLDGGKVNGAALVEAFVGNPPFAGGLTISGQYGNAYIAWGRTALGLASAKADLCAYFFARLSTMLGEHGTIGLIATNTVAQGDTREAALSPLLNSGYQIYSAQTAIAWPGDAAVTVAVVHLAKGRVECGVPQINGLNVVAIDSFLRPRRERRAPASLMINEALAFQGSIALGDGFVLEEEEARSLLAADARLSEVIIPYIGGSEVSSTPTQVFERYIINFGSITLEEAQRWPVALEIVRQRVKPARDAQRDDQASAAKAKQNWWRFWAPRDQLYNSIQPLDRCLVTLFTAKYLTFSFQPVGRVYANTLWVFPLPAATPFGVLQSRVHEFWARLLSSTMEDRLRYAASDCFETFPFPVEDPRTIIPELEQIGEELYTARAAFMVDTDQGLTKTYNALKDPHVTDPRVVALRTLHESMDAAVLAAYGWSDLTVPPFCIATDADRAALRTFEDEVIDRLFILNAERAKKEAVLGRASKQGKPAKATKPKSSQTEEAPKTTKKKKPVGGQGSLGWD